MKHAIIIDNSLTGREYGSLRSFEQQIISKTNAEIIELPNLSNLVLHRFGHTMTAGRFRNLFFKKKIEINADVIWCILMGPENYKLDLFNGWYKKAKYRIVYLFDTLEHQLPLIQRLFSNNQFNIFITSFNEAVPVLERLTKRKWLHVEQAVSEFFFKNSELDRRIIAFSSYGRRDDRFHELIKSFCRRKGLIYDYTAEIGGRQIVSNLELYEKYAFLLQHSVFSISWPVEITNKQRSGSFSPVTCRWFEAAMSGSIIIGQAPNNVVYKKYFPKDNVLIFDLKKSDVELMNDIENIWVNRHVLFEENQEFRNSYKYLWTWQARINEIINYINEK